MELPQSKAKRDYYQKVENKLNAFRTQIQNTHDLPTKVDLTNQLLVEVINVMEKVWGLTQSEIVEFIPEEELPTIKTWPDSVNQAIIASVKIVAITTAYQLPDFRIPSGYLVTLKAWPDNTGTLYLAFNEVDCLTATLSWPLLKSEDISWRLKNTNAVYVSGTKANDRLVITVEKRR